MNPTMMEYPNLSQLISTPAVTLFLSTIVAFILYRNIILKRKRLPPGPRRLPFVGGAHHIPRVKPWVTFGQWSKIYGASHCSRIGILVLTTLLPGHLIHLHLGGQSTLIVNSWSIANDMMEKRSSLYSDRPTTVSGVSSYMIQSLMF